MEKHNDIIVSANCRYALPLTQLASANHSTLFKHGENV
jgi:hypothetical protein